MAAERNGLPAVSEGQELSAAPPLSSAQTLATEPHTPRDDKQRQEQDVTRRSWKHRFNNPRQVGHNKRHREGVAVSKNSNGRFLCS